MTKKKLAVARRPSVMLIKGLGEIALALFLPLHDPSTAPVKQNGEVEDGDELEEYKSVVKDVGEILCVTPFNLQENAGRGSIVPPKRTGRMRP